MLVVAVFDEQIQIGTDVVVFVPAHEVYAYHFGFDPMTLCPMHLGKNFYVSDS